MKGAMRRPGRRTLLAAGGVLGGLVAGAWLGFPRLARQAPPDGPLSAEAAALLERAWSGLDPSRVLDCHVHVVGLGAGGTGCFVNPNMTDALRHPIQYARFSIYRRATGITSLERADHDYAERLVELARWGPRHGRHLLLAFDQVHREDGTPDPGLSEFYVPNDWVLDLARRHPDCFVPAASVHPYRKDAASEIDRLAALGVGAVKWLPNAHRIDPSSPRCDEMYRRLAATGVPLLTHAGLEQAVEAEEAQKLGNPLLLRRALDAGVKVIVAHAASSGQAEDLDAPGTDKPMVDAFDLFLRMLEQPGWRGRLWGDVSALTQFNRCDKLARLLERPHLHERLVNGSDYPLPAINVLVRTGKLESLGLVTSEERALLNEIDRHNPLAFDFAMKRVVRSNGKGFADSLFMPPAGLFPLPAS
jgi:predicted TIM-barrel fold metal-dependent hydrolase